MNKRAYITAEFYRVFGNRYWYTCVLTVWGLFVLSTYIGDDRQNLTALESLDNSLYGMTGLLCLMICSFSYAGSLSEDIENRYLIAECMRGNVRNFTRARALLIFLSALLTMITGTVCYALFVAWRSGGWYSQNSSSYLLLKEMGGWYTGILEKYPIIYFVIAGCLYGLLAGLLALLSALFSLFVSNKLLTASVPFLSMYLLLNLSVVSDLWNGWLNVWNVFQPFYNVTGSDTGDFLYAVLFSVIAGYLLYCCIFWRTKWRIIHG